MQKALALLALSLTLVGVASAQSKIEHPFAAEVGLYVPTFSDGNTDLGVNVGLGYSFYRKNSLDVAAVARGSFFHGSIDGIGYDATLGTYGVDVRYRPEGQKYFVGAGLAAPQVSLDFDGPFSANTTKLGYSVEAGYDFTKKVYGVVRYQATTDDIAAYRGVTVGVGYRF